MPNGPEFSSPLYSPNLNELELTPPTPPWILLSGVVWLAAVVASGSAAPGGTCVPGFLPVVFCGMVCAAAKADSTTSRADGIHAAPRTLIEPAPKPHAFLLFIIASLRFILLALILGPGRMIRAVDEGVALQTSLTVCLISRTQTTYRYGSVAGCHI